MASKDRVDIFSQVDLFEAGTFLYQRNPYYEENLTKFLQAKEKQYERQKNRHQRIADEVAELGVQIKHFRKFVPIFPYLYKTLDSGRKIGNRKSFMMFKDRRTDVFNKVDIRFLIRDNVLLPYEDSREKEKQLQAEYIGSKPRPAGEYVLHLFFKNIKCIQVRKDKVSAVPRTAAQEKKVESEKANFYEKKLSKAEEEEIFRRNNSQVELIIHLKKPC